MIIGTEYKNQSRGNYILYNIPYDKHDHPCWEGCCKNSLTLDLEKVLKISWLLHEYMPTNNILEFDFSQWEEKTQQLWKERLK
jgi:hypothetical protein